MNDIFMAPAGKFARRLLAIAAACKFGSRLNVAMRARTQKYRVCGLATITTKPVSSSYSFRIKYANFSADLPQWDLRVSRRASKLDFGIASLKQSASLRAQL